MCSVQRECTSHREEIDVHPLSHSSTVNKVGKLSHWVVTFWFCSYHTLSAFVATQSGTSSLNMRRTLLFWLISGGKIESNKSPGNLYYVRASLIYSKIMAIEPVDFFLFLILLGPIRVINHSEWEFILRFWTRGRKKVHPNGRVHLVKKSEHRWMIWWLRSVDVWEIAMRKTQGMTMICHGRSREFLSPYLGIKYLWYCCLSICYNKKKLLRIADDLTYKYKTLQSQVSHQFSWLIIAKNEISVINILRR